MFSSFFKSKVECPRCLGKGNVDLDDIIRLGKKGIWIPGKCAYCNGKGKVSSDMLSKVKADNPYLTTNTSKEERMLMIQGHHASTCPIDIEMRLWMEHAFL